MKTKPNAPCPCGSGQKYKRCHGSILHSSPLEDAMMGAGRSPLPGLPRSGSALPPPMRNHLEGLAAREFRRVQMQGHGRPIISTVFEGHRFVAVRNRMHYSKSWKTFEDFLLDYVKTAFGPDWGSAELRKPVDERHPLLRWYVSLCELQKADMTGPRGTIYTSTMTNAAKAYLNLAYDLYLLDHNVELQASLVDRLKRPDHFEGAVHEAHVAGMFAKAGFDIALEDEADITSTHVEFVATHRATGKMFAVEAKAFRTSSGKAADLTRSPTVWAKLEDALKKKTEHERVVVIELARPEEITEEPSWLADMDAEMERAEATLYVRGKLAPPAYVIISNRPCIWGDSQRAQVDFAVGYGFKIPDFLPRKPFTSILAAVKAKRRHAAVEDVFRAIRDFSHVPSTFGDDLPEERLAPEGAAADRLRIGARYVTKAESGEERTGVVVDALVMEAWRKIIVTIRQDDGSGDMLYEQPLSDAELDIYRASPDTFFGVLRPVSKGIETPLDAFDFFYKAYRTTSRERLLELMANWPNSETFAGMSDGDLLDHYCDRWATHMWNEGQKKRA